jgi:hypothetical protein
MGNELGAIVHSQMGGCWILIEKFLNRVDHIDSLASSPNTNSQAHATVFIHNIEYFQSTSIHRLVELEVDRPHVVRVLGSE